MKYKKLAACSTFIGSLIGAGFASGREIALYFGGTSFLTPLFSGIFLGFLCYFFLLVGKITRGDAMLLFPKGRRLVDWVIRICNIVTFCAMLAGSEGVLFALFGFHGGSVITAILTLITVLLGSKKIGLTNFIIVPSIIIMIGVLFFKDRANIELCGKLSALPAFTYATMNIVSGGYFISTFSADFSKKDCIQVGIMSGVVLSILLLAVFITIQTRLDAVMPLMLASEENGLRTVGYVVMYLSIYTSLTCDLAVAAKKNALLAVGITALSLVVSVLGFKFLVNKLYPLVGAVGGVITALFFIFYRRYKKTGDIPSSRSFQKLIVTRFKPHKRQNEKI